jgi:hypothetical protein
MQRKTETLLHRSDSCTAKYARAKYRPIGALEAYRQQFLNALDELGRATENNSSTHQPLVKILFLMLNSLVKSPWFHQLISSVDNFLSKARRRERLSMWIRPQNPHQPQYNGGKHVYSVPVLPWP